MNTTKTTLRIIACSVFKPALQHFELERRYPGLRLSYLPSNLHMRPLNLRVYLLRRIAYAQKRNERIICLYGDCFPELDRICQRYGVTKVPGFHCYEILLGSGQFQTIIDETAGTFFLERDLIVNFEEYCVEPLELFDEEIRSYCFHHYHRVLYVRQPSDPDLISRAWELAEFLGLPLEIREADYSHLERNLIKLI